MSAKRRLAAIMFTDIAGYSALTQKDEALAVKVLNEHRRLARPVFQRFEGREIKTMGDGFLVEFASAIQAVECAVELQRTLAAHNAISRPEARAEIRIGIHVGDVIHQDNDVLGDGVNVASRIEPLADPGGICFSEQVHDHVHGKLALETVKLSRRKLKNIATPVDVYRVVLPWQSSAARPAQTAQDQGTERTSIAVLPFVNMSADPENEYFSDGLTEELINALTKIQGLQVTSRTSVFAFKGRSDSIRKIGEQLGVNTVLEGSVRKAGDRLRITAQLINVADDYHLWSERYDRPMADIFKVQDEISSAIVDRLRIKLGGKPAALVRPSTQHLDAYTHYLQGRYFWSKRTEEALQKSIERFAQAVHIDPGFALAHAGAADSYNALALLEFQPPKQAFPKAKAAVEEALQLDPHLAEAHASLGWIHFMYDWDLLRAEDQFKQAIALCPNYAVAHHYYADLLKATARFDEALAEIRRAHELDPLSLAINNGVGHVLYLSRRYDQAIEHYRKTLELDPTFVPTRLWFGRPFLQKGMYQEAVAEVQQALHLTGGSTVALATLGHVYAAAGEGAKAREVLASLLAQSKQRYVPSYWIAFVYVGLDDKERAFEWLDKAVEERSSWLAWFQVEPRFDGLRSDARYERLLTKMRSVQR